MVSPSRAPLGVWFVAPPAEALPGWLPYPLFRPPPLIVGIGSKNSSLMLISIFNVSIPPPTRGPLTDEHGGGQEVEPRGNWGGLLALNPPHTSAASALRNRPMKAAFVKKR